MNNRAFQAAKDWQNVEDNSADVDTGIEALGRLISALSEEGIASYFATTIIAVAAKLVELYCDHGTDPDGHTTLALQKLLHQANLL